MQIIRIPEGENQIKGMEQILQSINLENETKQTPPKKFPENRKDLKLHIERAYHIAEIIDPDQPIPPHILLKLLDFKEEEKFFVYLEKKSM